MKDLLYNSELFLAWSITIFVVLNSVGFLGLISLLEFIGVKNSFAWDCGGQPSDSLEEKGKSLLFSSSLKRLQSGVSQHVSDTLIDDHLYSAILRSLEQTHCARL